MIVEALLGAGHFALSHLTLTAILGSIFNLQRRKLRSIKAP